MLCSGCVLLFLGFDVLVYYMLISQPKFDLNLNDVNVCNCVKI